MLLGTRDRLMCRASGTKPVTGFREGMVPTGLQNLLHRLLNQSIQHGWALEGLISLADEMTYYAFC